MSPSDRSDRHAWLIRALGTGFGLWIRLCEATTRWDRRGEAELGAALATGPVVVVLWHERLAMAGVQWRGAWGPVSALHTKRFVGRVAGAAQEHVGLLPIAMESRSTASNRSASREIFRRLRGGVSIGITGDGPSGPAREMKAAPLEWACATGRPVFVYAWAGRPQAPARSWDRLVLPLPFTRGAALWRPWPRDLPKRPDPETLERLRLDLAAALDAVTAEAEALAHSPQRK